MQFVTLVSVLEQLEQTSSRNTMTELLAELFASVELSEVRQVSYLVLGQLGPLFARVDFGVADKMAVRSIARAVNIEAHQILAAFKQTGDLGLVTEAILTQTVERETREDHLTVKNVYERLCAIAQANGEGSQEEKISLLASLINSVGDAREAKYVMRIVLGKMRLGFSDKTILDALAVMVGGSKAGRTDLDYAYQVSPDIGWIAEQVKQVGISKLATSVKPEVGVPVIPALAQRLKSADDMIAKMGKVVVEPKYDGTRVQIHYKIDGTGKIQIQTFARSLEETTAMFPELSEAARQLNATSTIIDCEAVGYDPTTGKLLPFQETITRKRKHGVADLQKTLPIKFFCFDVIYINGISMLHKPLYERRQQLEQMIEPGHVLVVDPLLVTDSADELRLFHQTQLDQGLEGAMVKQYSGEYQPGRTGWNWVKFKEIEEARGKLRDTIDGVVMGYYRGRGKRSSFGIGAFLFGVRDEDTGTFVTVAKIGTGLSDEQWRELRQRVDTNFANEKPKQYQVADGLVPDIWAEPNIVVEIAADEITKSPLHTSKLGLRFPRMVRFRQDKTIDQTTTIRELALF